MKPSIEQVETSLIVAAGAIAAGAALYEGGKFLHDRGGHQSNENQSTKAGENIILDNTTSGDFNFGELSPEYSH